MRSWVTFFLFWSQTYKLFYIYFCLLQSNIFWLESFKFGYLIIVTDICTVPDIVQCKINVLFNIFFLLFTLFKQTTYHKMKLPQARRSNWFHAFQKATLKFHPIWFIWIKTWTGLIRKTHGENTFFMCRHGAWLGHAVSYTKLNLWDLKNF